MSHAPHLPPKTEQPPKNFKEFLVFLGITVAVAFSAGIAASAFAFAYLIPETPVSRPVLTFFQNKPSTGVQKNGLTEDTKQSVKEKTVILLDAHKKIGEMYDSSAVLGQAAFLTLDGWAVLAPVNAVPTDVSALEAVDSQGRFLKIKKVVKDDETGFVFIQVEGNGFTVFSLGTGNIPSNSSVWSFDGKNFFEQTIAVQYFGTKETAKNIFAQGTKLAVLSGVPQMLVGENGEFSGLSDKSGMVYSGNELNTKLRFFQKNGILLKSNFAVGGYVVEGVKKDERGVTQHYHGFVVTELSRGGKTGLLGGDILLQVAGREFSPQTVREEIVGAGSEVVFHVLRNGKEIDVTVKK